MLVVVSLVVRYWLLRVVGCFRVPGTRFDY